MIAAPAFEILRASDIPDIRILRAGARRGLEKTIAAALRLRGEAWASQMEALAETRALYEALPSGDPLPVDGEGVDGAVHDAFFGVARIDGERSQIFLRSLVAGYAIFLRDAAETPWDVAVETLDRLDVAFGAATAIAIGTNAPAVSRVRRWIRPAAAHLSMRRWICGHQIFAMLTQGLILAFTALGREIDAGRPAALARAVDRAVALLDGAAAALEFTGDIPPHDYATLIRPSMTPPLVPDSFSGLLATDHRHFVALLRELKPALDDIGARRPVDHRRIAAAVGVVYDSHRYVCERLVGKAPSLMMSGRSEKSGGDQIETFKKLRMRAFKLAGS